MVTPEFKVRCITFAARMGESGSMSVFVNKVLLENPSCPLTYDNLPFILAQLQHSPQWGPPHTKADARLTVYSHLQTHWASILS